MSRVFKPGDAGEQQAFLASHCDRCTRSLGKPCDILEAVTVNDVTDPDYPGEWVLDDLGRPTCTAFESRSRLDWPFGGAPERADTVQPETAVSPTPEAEEIAATAACDTGAAPPIESVQVVTIGKGVIDACRLRGGKRSWTVPYADVSELFTDRAVQAMRDGFELPDPVKARVHKGKTHVTITARSSQDGKSVSSSVRLRFGTRGSARRRA